MNYLKYLLSDYMICKPLPHTWRLFRQRRKARKVRDMKLRGIEQELSEQLERLRLIGMSHFAPLTQQIYHSKMLMVVCEPLPPFSQRISGGVVPKFNKTDSGEIVKPPQEVH